MVGNQHLVHAQKLRAAQQTQCLHAQPRLFENLATDTGFWRFTGLHKARNQAENALLPQCIARQQHPAVITFHHSRQHRRGIAPMREPATRATQTLHLAAVLAGHNPLQLSRAVGTKADFISHEALRILHDLRKTGSGEASVS